MGSSPNAIGSVVPTFAAESGSGGGAVASVYGRVGAVVAAFGDYAASQVSNDSFVPGGSVAAALNALAAAIAAGVSSVYGRTGAVVAAVGDYAASQVNNDSAVAGATVKAALDALATLIAGGVSSVYGRTGAVVAAVGDYVASQVNNDSAIAGATVKAALDGLGALDLVVRLDQQTIAAAVEFVNLTLAGDTYDDYIIDYYIVNGTGGAVTYRLLPNGVDSSGSFKTVGIPIDGSTAIGAGFMVPAEMHINGGTRQRISGQMLVLGRSGKARLFQMRHGSFDAAGVAALGYVMSCGLWADTATLLNTLRIDSDNASGIGIGSIFTVWGVRR